MGKKIDLNAPRNNNNIKKSNHNFYHLTSNNINNDGNQEEKAPNAIQKKGAEMALRSVGVPSGLAKTLAQDNRTYEAAKKMQGTLIFPKSTQFVIKASLIAIPFVLILVFVMFADDESNSITSVGNYMYGETCTTITITDTDCDANGDNCTNQYNGKVDFENYIAGVVAAKENIINNTEYYKISAIDARTKVLSTIDSDCTVKGNDTYQKYMDINDSPYKDEIKKAVEETKGLVIVEDNELIEKKPISVKKISTDNDNYYIEYKTSNSSDIINIAINKKQEYVSNFSTQLNNYANDANQSYSSDDEINISEIITSHLTIEKNYKYEEVIEHYYGSKAKTEENKMNINGINGFVNPTRSIVCTSAFGTRKDPISGKTSSHGGLDIAVHEPIYAVKSGTVTTVTKNVTVINAQVSNATTGYGYGNHIIIDHGDGTSTVYAHIQYNSIPNSIYNGAIVEQGEQIGITGSTGRSTGIHLHYEVRIDGERVDPADYLDLSEASGTCKR